ncbi:hypothetical protein MYAM1_000023 [Malassezia yamatoensis]|uniref:TATA-binding protein interacting (TIP20) domain-containing protein n=1 Tax=Malassezia yamatoensis TaxID=253288 RepID=A0AAJ5YQG8_9BASI|nr:hypothetical protein MYAM1_000023 [Malassezia yamatoensis]
MVEETPEDLPSAVVFTGDTAGCIHILNTSNKSYKKVTLGGASYGGGLACQLLAYGDLQLSNSTSQSILAIARKNADVDIVALQNAEDTNEVIEESQDNAKVLCTIKLDFDKLEKQDKKAAALKLANEDLKKVSIEWSVDGPLHQVVFYPDTGEPRLFAYGGEHVALSIWDFDRTLKQNSSKNQLENQEKTSDGNRKENHASGQKRQAPHRKAGPNLSMGEQQVSTYLLGSSLDRLIRLFDVGKVYGKNQRRRGKELASYFTGVDSVTSMVGKSVENSSPAKDSDDKDEDIWSGMALADDQVENAEQSNESNALRMLMNEIDTDKDLGMILVDNLAMVFVEQVQSPAASYAQKLSALDALLDLLSHFTSPIVSHEVMQQSLLEALLSLLSENSAIVKRSIQGLGILGTSCSASRYDEIVDRGLSSLANFSAKSTCTAVQLLGVLARETPLRLRPVGSDKAFKLLSVILKVADIQESESGDFLESCLQTLNALMVYVLKPGTMDLQPFIIQTLSLIKFDPNTAFSDGEQEDFEDDDDDLDDYDSDDDDLSWRVRRAAAKVLATFCNYHLDSVRPVAYTVASTLVNRFSEHEESVRLEILSTFVQLLQLLAVVPHGAIHKRKRDVAERTAPFVDLLPHAVSSLCKQVKSGSVASQIASLDTLNQLTVIFDSNIERYCAEIISAVNQALPSSQEFSSYHRNRNLTCISLLSELTSAAPIETSQALPYVIDVLILAIRSNHHKTTLEGLQASSNVTRNIGSALGSKRIAMHFSRLYEASLELFQRPNLEQDLREAALNTLSVVMRCIGQELGESVRTGLDVICACTTNELIRTACLKVSFEILGTDTLRPLPAVSAFAQALLDPLLQAINSVDASVRALSSQCLLECLSLIGMTLSQESRFALIRHLQSLQFQAESPSLVPTLRVIKLLAESGTAERNLIAETLLPSITGVLSSSLLPSEALTAICDLLGSLREKNVAVISSLTETLMESWTNQKGNLVYTVPNPLAYARCLCAATNTTTTLSNTLQWARDLINDENDTTSQTLGYHIIGVLGMQQALGVWPQLRETLMLVLQTPDRPGCAFALAGMILDDAGNSEILSDLFASNSLNALKVLREALINGNEKQVYRLQTQFWSRLLAEASSLQMDEASQSNFDLLCECLARMVFVDMSSRLEQLENEVQSSSTASRATVLGVIRILVTLDRGHTLDSILAPRLWRYLQLLGDENLLVRRGAVMALHATLYNRPELVREHLPSLLPQLYEITVVREDLKRKVAMGPFTVITDDGLDLRKNALETLLTLLETCLADLAVEDIVRCAIQALKDEDSIKLFGCVMLTRLTDVAADQIKPFLDELSPALRAIIFRNVRENATKHEAEKANELIRASVRVLGRLAADCDVSAHSDLCELLLQTQQSPHASLLNSAVS